MYLPSLVSWNKNKMECELISELLDNYISTLIVKINIL